MLQDLKEQGTDKVYYNESIPLIKPVGRMIETGVKLSIPALRKFSKDLKADLVDVEHPVTGNFKYPGAPFRAEEMPWQVKRAAPLLGQHNEEVYGALGYTKEDLVRLRETGVI